jgi:MFS family permease
LVLLVSCAHALVHIYELTLPSVEQLIGRDFHVDQTVTGSLGSTFRIPFGAFAFVAGWFVDRTGSKPLLILFLLGCAGTSVLAYLAPTLGVVFVAMFGMGTFASIYHPAGLSLISHETRPDQRAMALGYHGIVGSIGIAAAPLLAGAFLATGGTWQQYYLVLAIPGVVLAIVFALRLVEHHREPRPANTPRTDAQPADPQQADAHVEARAASHAATADAASTGGDASRPGSSMSALDSEEDEPHWGAFAALTLIGALGGFIYAGLLSFLPRYLGQSGLHSSVVSDASYRNYLTSGVLLCGCIGQYLAGRWAKPGRLEPFLMLIILCNAPFLFWMAMAQGWARIWAAGLFALVHFMHQPVYNTLVASYVPTHRRSFGYGVSNTITFGIGGLGAGYVGFSRTNFGDAITYSSLGCVALVAAFIAGMLWQWRIRRIAR